MANLGSDGNEGAGTVRCGGGGDGLKVVGLCDRVHALKGGEGTMQIPSTC